MMPQSAEWRWLLWISCWMGWLAAPGITWGSPVIRIMPLGDSLTAGLYETGGYRTRLYQRLSSAGYRFDFVGSGSFNGHPDLPDPDHEGHSGLRIDQIDMHLIRGGNWLAAEPDLILLLIGTNDFGQRYDPTNAIHRLDALITKITVNRPNARLIVGNLCLRTDVPEYEQEIQVVFNPGVPEVVRQHRMAGEQVSFVDLHSVLGPEDLFDGAHPNATGYGKLGDAWFAAIQAVLAPEGDPLAPPQIIRANGGPGGTQVTLTFSKPLADSATNRANFGVDGGLALKSVAFGANTFCDLILTTGLQAHGIPYTLTVNGVRDRASNAQEIAPNSPAQFYGLVPAGALQNVPEAKGYTLVYALDLPDQAAFNTTGVPYTVDQRAQVPLFSRIAYYLELWRSPSVPEEFMYVSMAAFTTNVNQIGIPSADTGAFFHQIVTNLHVYSGVAGNVTGVGVAEGALEFWSGDYGTANSARIPNAKDDVYDFGDDPYPGGYGSLQIHHHAAGEVLLAYNGWGNGGVGGFSDLGIGNNLGNRNLDWTFMGNAGGYVVKHLQVLVLPARVGVPVTLTWPGADSGNVGLQRADRLEGTNTVWLSLTNEVTRTQGRFEVLMEAEAHQGFFRLVQ